MAGDAEAELVVRRGAKGHLLPSTPMHLLGSEAGQVRRRSRDCKFPTCTGCARVVDRPCFHASSRRLKLTNHRPDGTIDHSGDKSKLGTNGTAVPAHKLGPKANTGAINAGLRALDRSGKPCRRWERKGMQLKSFTGTPWAMTSWRAPEFPGDVKSDSTGGSSDVKESSAVASERSNGGGDNEVGDVAMAESSPAPAAVAA